MQPRFATLMLSSNRAAFCRLGSSLRRTWVRRLASSTWLLIALHVLSVACSSAVASCGDYVTMGRHDASSGRHDASSHNSTAQSTAARAAQTADSAASSTASQESPCADGQCSNPCRNGRCHRAPAGLPAAPASQITLSIQQWALLAAALLDDSPRCAFRFITDSGVVASGYPPSIDHPPQFLF